MWSQNCEGLAMMQGNFQCKGVLFIWLIVRTCCAGSRCWIGSLIFFIPLQKDVRGVFFNFNSAIGLITFTVSALWHCVLYQMKARSFPSRQIPNTLIYYARLFGNIAVWYSTFISLNCFLAVKQYAFLTVYEGSEIEVFPQIWTFSGLLIILFQSLLKQFLTQVCTFFTYGILSFLYDVIDLYIYVKYNRYKNYTFKGFHDKSCDVCCK